VSDQPNARVKPVTSHPNTEANGDFSSERLKPYYARRVIALIICSCLLGFASCWLYIEFLGAIFDVGRSQPLTSHPLGNLVTALMFLSFLTLVPTSILVSLWAAGNYLRERGIIRPDDVRGFVLCRKYPSHWCYSDDEFHAKLLARSQWRRPRVGIRGLLGIVAGVAAGFALLIHGSRSQHDSVAAIERGGGKVGHDWVYDTYGRPLKQEGRRWFRWLDSWDETGVFRPARLVILDKTSGSDSQLVHVGRLGQLEALDLSFSSVTDSGLLHLERSRGLVVVHLRGTGISDAGLAHLAGLTRIQVLGLGGTHVTGAGLRHLRRLTEVIWLDLTKTKIGDQALEQLVGMTAIDTLGLGWTSVTDAGLVHVGRLTSLTWLNLDGTGVSDAGLEKLKGLVNLRTLEVRGTSVTPAGKVKLQRALPNLSIIH
jgi:hypothetical protein